MHKQTPFIIALLIVVSLISRLNSFHKEHPFTLDEYLYVQLGMQLCDDISSYSTAPLCDDLAKKGFFIPEYFRRPLFKHPPLFSLLISLSYRMFDRQVLAAFLIPLFFGVGLIGLAYLLGNGLFGRQTGLFAAALMAIEPIDWVCSGKIWMETTLAFFTVLALCLFVQALKKDDACYMIASGFSAGCAALTKYPGILATVIIALYACLWERQLFKKKSFLVSLVIPAFMLAPWFLWNWQAYGGFHVVDFFQMHRIAYRLQGMFAGWWMWGATGAMVTTVFYVPYFKTIAGRKTVLAGILLLFFLYFHHSLFATFSPLHCPETGWLRNMFINEPWHFYIRRLIELSPFYLFAFLSIALLNVDADHWKEYAFLFLSTGIILVFYIWWRNYQSRYILALAVPMMVLAAQFLSVVAARIQAIPSRGLRCAAFSCYGFIVLYAAAKTLYIDLVFAVPNTMCYF
ncbi:MAG: glycosyltransferase family 39 protein [Candidatus Omnitrophica bacterium]|nr:glycosyltransferase family 39 protein [Candidatus Omnitrophota bacterium]